MTVASAVAQLNSQELEAIGISLKRSVAEQDGQIHYAVCNTLLDEISKLANQFQKHEIDHFESLFVLAKIDRIVKSKTGRIPRSTAVELEGDLQKPLGRHFYPRLYDQGWLQASVDGELSLGVRTLLELRPYLESEYEQDLKKCSLCSNWVFNGRPCPNEQCNVKLHHYCLSRWTQIRQSYSCPSCCATFCSDAQSSS
ncbi:non-structural maintenance of chromosomes element 1 homolog [Schistocerca gregaria]|uniref:non-structural maintenance of chromosomes element 1 homolog n=1 Tax=Schistocerca gregaria TaxID=7010 RepID=UPI00211DC3B8|nr:non-structural maintenance of chromosomes element 1 homolog [Schistocerca gregaria]